MIHEIKKQLMFIEWEIDMLASRYEFEKFFKRTMPEEDSNFNMTERLKQIADNIKNLIELCTATKN